MYSLCCRHARHQAHERGFTEVGAWDIAHEAASRLASGTLMHMLTVMLDWSQCSAVERIPGKVSGVWLFKGTRIPVRALFENIEGGATVEEFIVWFPGVTREQVDEVLEHAQRSLVEI